MSESIFSKIRTAVVGKTHDILDQHEDVGTTARQTVRELEDAISKAEEELVAIVAQNNVLISNRDIVQNEVERYAEYAAQAVDQKNDQLALDALRDKQTSESKVTIFQSEINKLEPTIEKLKKSVGVLQDRLKQMKDRSEQLDSRATIAASEDKVATLLTGIGSGESAIAVFDRLEDKVQHAEAQAQAKSQLADSKMVSPEDKYATLKTSSQPSVQDQLAALKASRQS